MAAFCQKTQDPGEPKIYVKNTSTTSWRSVENSGRFTRKKENIDSGQTSGSVRDNGSNHDRTNNDDDDDDDDDDDLRLSKVPYHEKRTNP